MTPEPLGRTLDLADPETLCLALEDLAGGMRQQAAAAQSGTAMGGHPNPSFLYARVEEGLRAAKAMIAARFLPTEPAYTPGAADSSGGTDDGVRVTATKPIPPPEAPPPHPAPKPAPAGRK